MSAVIKRCEGMVVRVEVVERREGSERVECTRGAHIRRCNPGTLCSQNSYVIPLNGCNLKGKLSTSRLCDEHPIERCVYDHG